jgi:hypothetical protein
MLSRLVEAMIIAVRHCARRLGQGGRNLLIYLHGPCDRRRGYGRVEHGGKARVEGCR